MSNLECGHPDTLPCGRDEAGNRYCYECCTQRDREAIVNSTPGHRFFAYESTDGSTVTNWPGGELMRIIWHSRKPHHMSRERFYIRATDELGRIWSGTSACGMWANLRLTKQRL